MPKNNKWQMPAEEKSLDQWVADTMAPINDTIYSIVSQISIFIDSLKQDLGI